MISVAEARASLLSLVSTMPVELCPLSEANGRVLAEDMVAAHAQPPFAASAMDGYAVAIATPSAGSSFTVVGESAAGHPYPHQIGKDEAVRIFTGAPVPAGAVHVIIQEKVFRKGDRITVDNTPETAHHIRPEGGDFAAGHVVRDGQRLRPQTIALLGAMGQGQLPVRRQPRVAILSTGDELRAPGDTLDPGTIYASNGEALASLLSLWGASPARLPLVRDTENALALAFELSADADLILTVGGASVGDHDLVAPAAMAAGFELEFQKVAMRPGKPLMAGRRPGQVMVGLPGNPVSAFVCALVFVQPMIQRMLGLSISDPRLRKELATAIPANGPRQHYMRALSDSEGRSTVFENQDSSLLTILEQSDHLVIRPPHDPARRAGDVVNILPLPT